MPDKEETKVPTRKVRDPHWRPVMFSRNTAMFTIPTDVRNEAGLVSCREQDKGAMITYDKKTGNIIIQPGVKKRFIKVAKPVKEEKPEKGPTEPAKAGDEAPDVVA